MSNLEIKHIYHSGFRIEFEDKIILIDVYNNLNKLELNQKKDIYFFVTHSHGDHYNAEILNFENDYKVKYVFSDDIITCEKDNIFRVKKGDKLSVDGLGIEVFGSTDLGVSFLINYNEYNLFHSGDLNWWHWENNSKESQDNEAADYKRELSLLIGKSIDIAFVPVDPRLGNSMSLAIDYFAKTIHPKTIVPMHFGERYEITENLKQENIDVVKIKSSLSSIYTSS